MIQKYSLFGLVLLALLSFTFSSESALAKMPERCEAFTKGYQELYASKSATEKAAFLTIKAKAEDLLKRITVEHEKKNQSIDNFSMRNEFRLKSFATREYFQETFGFLRRSACIRKDVNDLEDILSDIRLVALKAPVYLDEIDILQKEISSLRSCSQYEESVYFDTIYKKSECDGGEKERNLHIKTKFLELKEKITNLTTGAEWKNILKKEGWQSAISKEGQKEIREYATKRASSWISNNSLVKLLDYEKYFGSQVERGQNRGNIFKEIFLSFSSAKKKNQEGASQEGGKSEREEREEKAIQKDQLVDAFESLQEEREKITEEIISGEKSIDASVFTLLSTSTAELWKQEVKETADVVKNQTKFVKKQKEALRKLINRHGTNIPDGNE